ncbi:MAG TPA: hypothetical protein VJN95_11995 [Gemmatimonadales bacterium]|nr:hypothetical protein [Gemmatimonadales bacterium]
MSDPVFRLPPRPSLEQLKKQAKELLRLARDADAEAIRRLNAVRPAASEFILADAQFALARELGFASWPALVQHLEDHPPALEPFEEMARDLARAYSSGDLATLQQVNTRHMTNFIWDREPEALKRRLPTWYADAVRRPELALADARLLVAKKTGFDSWAQLAESLRERSRPRSGPGRPASPFYRVIRSEGRIETRGALANKDWDEVVEVILEQGLTHLEAGGLVTEYALERVGKLGQLRRVGVEGAPTLTDDAFRHLAGLVDLEYLGMGGWHSALTDRSLAILPHFPKLRHLEAFWQQRYTDAGMAHLAACRELEDVNLMGSRTGDGTIRALAGLTKLRHLAMGSRVTAAGLPALHDIPAFAKWSGEDPEYTLAGFQAGPNKLLLPHRPFSHGGLEGLAGLDGLFALHLFGMGESGGDDLTASAVQPLTRLAHLNWLACDANDESLAAIGTLPNLKMLMCQDTPAGDSGWTGLARSRTLEFIWARRTTGLASAGFTALSQMPSLKGFTASVALVDDAALARLPHFPALRQLMPVDISDGRFHFAASCRNLDQLWLMYCHDVGDTGMESLAGHPALKKFYAGSNPITDRSLAVLAGIPTLEEITFWDCRLLTDAGIRELACLPRLKRLQVESSPLVGSGVLAAFRDDVEVRIE